MRVLDPDYLKTLRGPGLCSLCGKPCQVREVHHVIAKGMGGGRQMDTPINTLSVGSTTSFECECHTRIDTKEGQERCWRVLADRFNTTPEALREANDFILRLHKRETRWTVMRRMCLEVTEAARPLILIALKITKEDIEETKEQMRKEAKVCPRCKVNEILHTMPHVHHGVVVCGKCDLEIRGAT